jgi:hypothetical protein
MVGSTGSQPRVRVKVRGSKWHAAEAEDRGNREVLHRDSEWGIGENRGWADHPSRDPGHGDQEPARAQ